MRFEFADSSGGRGLRCAGLALPARVRGVVEALWAVGVREPSKLCRNCGILLALAEARRPKGVEYPPAVV
jgi:hypothetical protein